MPAIAMYSRTWKCDVRDAMTAPHCHSVNQLCGRNNNYDSSRKSWTVTCTITLSLSWRLPSCSSWGQLIITDIIQNIISAFSCHRRAKRMCSVKLVHILYKVSDVVQNCRERSEGFLKNTARNPLFREFYNIGRIEDESSRVLLHTQQNTPGDISNFDNCPQFPPPQKKAFTKYPLYSLWWIVNSHQSASYRKAVCPKNGNPSSFRCHCDID